MMEKIRINFIDFWPGFVKEDNYFINLLSKYYQVEISNSPEIIFYSNYGKKYLEYSCIRIYFSGENIRPDFSACDFSLSFDYINDKRNYRLPLYVIYLGLQYFSGSLSKNISELTTPASTEQILENWRAKKKFCCMVVSNAHSKKRINFFQRLNKIKQVDSGGRALNNIGGPVKDKLSFINDYRFVIAFENSSHPGYVTEKILEPLSMGCIPVYWGNPVIERDFNKKRFLNYDDFEDEDALIKRMIELENNESEALKILSQPVFPGNEEPHFIKEQNVIRFLAEIIDNRRNCHPVGKNYFSRIRHAYKRRLHTIFQYIKAKIGKNNT